MQAGTDAKSITASRKEDQSLERRLIDRVALLTYRQRRELIARVGDPPPMISGLGLDKLLVITKPRAPA